MKDQWGIFVVLGLIATVGLWLYYEPVIHETVRRFLFVLIAAEYLAGACVWAVIIQNIYWKRFGKKQRPGMCIHCGYDLRATPNRCPECGGVPKGGPA